MKTITKMTAIGIAVLALVSAAPQKSYADDRTWATVGKILTGFVAADLALNHIDHDRAYTRTTVTYGYGDGHYTPRPRHVYQPPCPLPRWIPGHYETRYEQVWIEGYYRTVETPPVYGWIRRGHHPVWTIIKPACTTQVWVPGHYEKREVQVWAPGRYEQGYAYNY
jgi:hypothetical protein